MGISAGLATLALLGGVAGASATPNASVPAYVATAAATYLKAVGLAPSSPGPLTLKRFAVMLDDAADISGAPSKPYPSKVVGTGKKIRDLRLAVEDGVLPNEAPSTPVTGAIAEAAVAHAIGVGADQAMSSAQVHTTLQSLGMSVTGSLASALTPDQAATYLAQVFQGDPAVQPLLTRLYQAARSIRTMQATLTLNGVVPLEAAEAQSAGGSAITLSGVEGIRVELRPTVALAVRSLIHVRVGSETESERSVEIFAGKAAYIETFTSAGGTWYRIPADEVPNVTSLLDSVVNSGAIQTLAFSVFHPRVVAGPAGSIRLAEAAHLPSLTALLQAMPSALSGVSSTAALFGSSSLSIGVSALTVYNAHTLYPVESVGYVGISVGAGGASSSAEAAGIGETTKETYTVNKPVTITVPPAAKTAPYLPSGSSSSNGG
jgi:hypothetical protein